MRTRDDLDAAFALIADEAEDYVAAQHPAVRVQRRRPVVWLAAAAAAVVLVAAGGLWVRAQFTPTVGGSAGAANELLLRSLPFTVHRSSGVVIDEVWTTRFEQVVDVRVDGVTQQIELGTVAHPAAPGHLQLDVNPRTAERVDINGATGYYGCAGYASDPPACNPGLSTLAWRFGPDSWAQFGARTSAKIKAQMLRLARAMDFSRSAPLGSPVALTAAPTGTQLSGLVIGYPTPRRPHTWDFDTSYQAPGAGDGRDEISIAVSTRPVPSHGGGGRRVEVGGHAGWWEPGDDHNTPSRLFVDAGHGRTILVIGGASSGAPIPRTVEAFGTVAQSVRFAPDPSDRSTWFDAESALP